MKLHLGCGKLTLKDYINIDILNKNADIKLDIKNLSIFNSNKIEEIYICHVLEHFKRNEIIKIILEWNRVLKIGGILRISVPDFEKVVKLYMKNKDISKLIGFLSGGQIDEYDFHYVNFDMNILKEILSHCGFTDIKKYVVDEFLDEVQDDYSKCYLPHMDLKNGELMSLNIVCTKEREVKLDNILYSDKIKTFIKL